MNVKIITIIFSLVVFIFVTELIRKEKLTFKYALGWLSASALATFLAVFDKVIFAISKIFGFELPSNFIFFSLIGMLIILSLIMTIFLCQQNNRNDKIAQKVAILENEINELKKNNNF